MANIRYMVADDHPLFRAGIIATLALYPDFECVGEAQSGEQLLKILDKGATPDVVILDINMKPMNGKETLDAIQRYYPEIKVVFMTTLEDPAYAVSLMELGENAFLLKNTDPDEIVVALQCVMENDVYINTHARNAIKKAKREGSKDVFLSERELEILKLICQQKSTLEISKELHLSVRTVEGIRNKMMLKFDQKNTVGLVTYAMTNFLV